MIFTLPCPPLQCHTLHTSGQSPGDYLLISIHSSSVFPPFSPPLLPFPLLCHSLPSCHQKLITENVSFCNFPLFLLFFPSHLICLYFSASHGCWMTGESIAPVKWAPLIKRENYLLTKWWNQLGPQENSAGVVCKLMLTNDTHRETTWPNDGRWRTWRQRLGWSRPRSIRLRHQSFQTLHFFCTTWGMRGSSNTLTLSNGACFLWACIPPWELSSHFFVPLVVSVAKGFIQNSGV